MKTLELIVAGILADRDREAVAIRIHNAISAVLRNRFQGKKVNKRVEGYVVDELMARGVTVETEYIAGMTYLRVWGIGPFTGYSDCSRHFLGYAQDIACYDSARFAELDACNGEAAIRRNADRNSLLESGTVISLAKMIDKHNECYKAIKSLTENGSFGYQAHYIALRLLEGTEYKKRAEAEAREARRRC